MSNKCEWVSKYEIKKNKMIITNIIKDIQKTIKDKFGVGFNLSMVGSARRGLVVRRGNSEWDIDFQMIFHGEKILEFPEFEVKLFIRDTFKRFLPESYVVNLSKSVITINKIDEYGRHAISGYDIAIININSNEKKILRGKEGTSTRWELLGDRGNNLKTIREIKGKDQWGILREIYIYKKCKEFERLDNDARKDSSSLLLESIKETLDQNEYDF